MEDVIALTGLFVAAFGAATIMPFQSEIVFVALQSRGTHDVTTLVIVASIGNTLGSLVNYGMGRWMLRYRDRRWFPVSQAQLDRATGWYQKWGVWTLLFSWAPLGDALTAIAGVLRTPVWVFLTLVAIAKTLRYIALAWVTAGFLPV